MLYIKCFESKYYPFFLFSSKIMHFRENVWVTRFPCADICNFFQLCKKIDILPFISQGLIYFPGSLVLPQNRRASSSKCSSPSCQLGAGWLELRKSSQAIVSSVMVFLTALNSSEVSSRLNNCLTSYFPAIFCRHSHVEHPSHRVYGAACGVAGLHLLGPHLGPEGAGEDCQT